MVYSHKTITLVVLDGSDGPNDDLFLLRCVLSKVEIATSSLGCGILSDGVVVVVVVVGESVALLVMVGEVVVVEEGVVMEEAMLSVEGVVVIVEVVNSEVVLSRE